MKKIAIILFTICTLWTFNSCKKDFLEVPLYGSYTPESFQSKDAVNMLLTSCYSAMGGEMDGLAKFYQSPTQMFAGEVHAGNVVITAFGSKDLLQYNALSANANLLSYWTWLYDGVFRCNTVLKKLAVIDYLTDAEKLQVKAETLFLRAHFYFYLKRGFNNVPWIDENTVDYRVPNTINNDGTAFVNIWPQIAADMDFARKNLPLTQKDLGRPNKWAADCYYAKIQIYRANFGEYASGYSEALTILNDVMVNGANQKGVKYALQSNFYFNFSAAHNNSEESVFAIQHSVNDGTTSTNQFGASVKGFTEPWAYGVPSANGPGWNAGIGWGTVTFWVVDHYRVNTSGLPYLDMYTTNPNYVKHDYNILSSEPFVPETAPLDPRLDWTVGRRGIPFLDYMVMPGIDWVRGQNTKGPFIQKKVFVKNAEAGIYTKDKANIASSMNIALIRYADVLLLAAECEARVGSLSKSRDLVNEVRNRMVQNSASPNNWVKKADGTNAANYLIGLYPADGSADDAFTTKEKALDAILYERMLELACEGHRFFDIVRFGKDETELMAAAKQNAKWLSDYKISNYTRVPDAFLPIPTVAIDNSQKDGKPTLTQNPGY